MEEEEEEEDGVIFYFILQALLDIFLTVKTPIGPSSGQIGGSRSKLVQQLIYLAPPFFSLAVVELVSEIILITTTLPNRKLR